ncbi:MAG: hypothetical protein R3350_10320 [Saprospiraceae bacterium]|nr:hypothetical protein [Saprospiraceae bacterium]
MIQRFLIFAFLWASLGSCQQEPPPSEAKMIFADFFVRYLQTEQQLLAQATLMEGDSLGDTRPLVPSGGISFQGFEMEARQLPEGIVRYALIRSSSYPDSLRFECSLDGDRGFTYNTAMSPVIDFRVDDPIIKEKGLNLTLAGPALQADQSLVLLFTDQDDKASSVTLSGPRESNRYLLPPEKISKLSPGPGQLYLVKKQRRVDRQGQRSVVSEIEFYTRNKDIVVVEKQ